MNHCSTSPVWTTYSMHFPVHWHPLCPNYLKSSPRQPLLCWWWPRAAPRTIRLSHPAAWWPCCRNKQKCLNSLLYFGLWRQTSSRQTGKQEEGNVKMNGAGEENNEGNRVTTREEGGDKRKTAPATLPRCIVTWSVFACPANLSAPEKHNQEKKPIYLCAPSEFLNEKCVCHVW